jgi:DNA polymerase-3 subunit delta'
VGVLTLDRIRGQKRVVELLGRAIAQDRVPHAYLFCGPAGSGKMTTAVALAAAMQCIDAPGRGCGECVACSKIAAGIHPDVQVLERQGAAQIIPIETVRSQVIATLGLAPHEGHVRIFLVEEASSLASASANALLKTLEEPPLRTHFILCTTAPDQLLPTIRSRCQRVMFASLSAELRAEMHSQEAAEQVVARADALLAAARSADLDPLYQAAAEAAGERAEMESVLDRLAQNLHQEARQAAMSGDLIAAALASRQCAVVLRMRQALLQNAHGQVGMEGMLHEMRAVVA